MASYFRQVPNFDYISRNPGEKYISEYIAVKNFFKRGKIRDDIFENLQFFEKYSIVGDERPDNVASKFYGDDTLDWIILLSNNILNIQSEWPMTQRTFDKIMLSRYGSYDNLYNGVHHYETEEIKNSLGITVLKGGIRISPSWKTNGNFLEITNSKIEKLYAGSFITTLNGNITADDTLITVTDASEILDLPQSIVIGNEEIKVTSKTNNILTVERGQNNTTAVSHSNNESVDLIKATTTITVKMVNGILGLEENDQVTIDNISELQYNGKFTVTSITSKIDNIVYSFTYNLPSTPNVIAPVLSDPRKEEVNYTISEESLNPGNSYYYEYWDEGLRSTVQVPSTSFVKTVTNYEYESEIENEKRNIYVLKPRYLNIIFNDLDEVFPYKKGSQQYVSENLKRGDNIRLYE